MHYTQECFQYIKTLEKLSRILKNKKKLSKKGEKHKCS